MASTYSKHIIICGLGKIGYRVTRELLNLDQDVVAIDVNPQGRFIEKAMSLNIPVIIGDARRTENLIKAGVKHAEAVIPCTDDELTNLDIALDTRELNPDAKVVMRLFDPDLARRVEKGFGIHTALSSSALAAPIFAASAMRMNVKSSFYLDDSLMNISELTIEPGSKVAGWPLQYLAEQFDLTVISYAEDEDTQMHPDPNLVLTTGNKLLLYGTLDSLYQLEKLNRPN